jgi:hypothetical protein
VSQLNELSRRPSALAQGLQAWPPRPCPALAQSASPPLARERALNSSVFLRSGERLEHELAELKDMQWQIRENEARYRCSIIIRPTSFCAAMLRLDRASATRRSAGVLDVAPRLC